MVDESRHTDVRRVEIVHESLLNKWPRLVRWRAQDAEGALLRDHLRQAAQLWEERGRPEDLLWSGNAYREFSVWKVRYPGALSSGEEAFARAMVLRSEKRKRQARLVVIGILLAAITVAITTAALWRRSENALDKAVTSQKQAVSEARRAEAQKLLALAQLERESYPTAALAYATRSLEVADTKEGRRLVMDILWRGPVARLVQLSSGGARMGTNVSPDGKWIFSFSGLLRGDDFLLPSDGRPPRKFAHDIERGSFSDDGKFLLTWSADSVRIFSASAWNLVREIPILHRGLLKFRGSRIVFGSLTGPDAMLVQSMPLSGGSPEVIGNFHFSSNYDVHPSGSWGVVLSDGAVYRRAIAGVVTAPRSRDVFLWRPRQKAVDINFDQAGARVVATAESGLELYSIQDGRVRWLGVPQQSSETVYGPFHATESRVVAASDGVGGSQIWSWDLNAPPDAEPLIMKWAGLFGVADGTFIPGGEWLVTSAHTGEHAFWPVGLAYPHIIRIPKAQQAELAFIAGSGLLAVCTEPGGVKLISVKQEAESRAMSNPPAFCHCLAIDKTGENVIAGGFDRGVSMSEVAGTSSRRILETPDVVPSSVALDPSGQIAVVVTGGRTAKPLVLHVIDLQSNSVKTFPVPRPPPDGTLPFPIRSLAFGADGVLYSAGDGGILRWQIQTGASEIIYGDESRTAMMSMSGDGQRMLVAVGTGDWSIEGELFLFDLAKGTRHQISTHGSDFGAMAIDHSGQVIATADTKGTIRVGRSGGEDPHLFSAQPLDFFALALSPDGRWIASASKDQIRLWPMPDLSRPPLHTLPHDQLVAKLHELTNLRAVPDPTSFTGYKLELAPFPGWERVPEW